MGGGGGGGGGRDYPSPALDMDMDMDNINPILDLWDGGIFPPSPLPQYSTAAISLMRFREAMDQRIAGVDAHFSDPFRVLQSCRDEGEAAQGPGAEVENPNPAALLLKCSQEFIDIIQTLTPPTPPTSPTPTRPTFSSKDDYTYPPHNQQLVSPHFAPAAMPMPTTGEGDALSTEIVLLALSGYLALMRLYDSLFHCVYQCLCQMPPDALKSLKVKSVLRIGGIATLQDMPLKTYATGILDAIQGQVRTLERCMGIPAAYCLSGEVAASHTTHTPAAPGMFSRADRARLFCAVMAQEDVKSRQGSKSYVESIRASIQDSVVCLDWMTRT